MEPAAKKNEGRAVRGNPAKLTNAGKGRPKGVPNKTTKALREMILGALDKEGGEKWLVKLAQDKPESFATLLGKVLPTTLAGDPNAPVVVQHQQVENDAAAFRGRLLPRIATGAAASGTGETVQ